MARLKSKTDNFKLTYFDAEGRAELTRLIFTKAGQKFEDERVNFDDWEKVKDTMPMGTLPILHYDGHKLCQSFTIARFAAKKCKLVGKTEMDEYYCDMFVTTLSQDLGSKLLELLCETDGRRKALLEEDRTELLKSELPLLENLVKGNFVLGDAMSYADLAIFDFETLLNRVLPDSKLPAKLKSIADKVKADPAIAAYLAKKPETMF